MVSEPVYGHARLKDFALDPAKVHLNHGSFGAVPNVLAEVQDRWRTRLEANPTGLFRGLPGLLRQTAARVAEAFGGRAEDWVFVENATQGANAAIPALALSTGDHVLATTEIYNAVRQTLRHRAGRWGVEVEELALPVPLAHADQVLDAFETAIRPNTRAVFVDHVTSRSALVLPVARIAALAREKGVACFVDGAHGPGMVEIEVAAIGADWYVGNAHKWLYAPRGCALFWTAPERQAATHPVVISHGYQSGYTAEFDWIGTRDPTAWLTAASALDWHESQGGAALRARSHDLACLMADRLAGALGTEPSGPPELMGAMAAVRLPGPPSPSTRERAVALDQTHDVVVSLNRIDDADWLRVSAALYNEASDIDALLEALASATA
ncbi:MAG: aminotransferase class V-fold PLP-dependent enzyme [Alphaproteobacteria bacterium]|jgi:isopenicillin-N epimerase|nr:aminotransferase class V-fold PLP-dependent enzyme [Alphaproteobacteria bacterium]